MENAYGKGTRVSIMSMVLAWCAFYTGKLTDNPFWANVSFIGGLIGMLVAFISGIMAIRYYYHATKKVKNGD